MSLKRRETDLAKDASQLDRIYIKYRAYWHVISFLVIITFLASTKWSEVQACCALTTKNDITITEMQKVLSNLVLTQATTQQEVHDIHDKLIGNR